MNQTEKRTIANSFSAILILSFAILIPLMILHFGNIQFGGMDGSVLTNAAWQLHLGYLPYKDVITAAPPLFLLGAKWAFDLFGIRWNSFVIITAIFASITFLLQTLLLRKLGLKAAWSIFLSLTIQCVTLIPISWWWYNQITAVIGGLYLSSALLITKKPNESLNQILFAVFAALLMLSKANLAVLLLFPSALIFMFNRKNSWQPLFLLGATALIATSTLILTNINPFQMFSNYLFAGNRVLSIDNLSHFFFINNQEEPALTLFALSFSFLAFLLTCIKIILLRTEDRYPIFLFLFALSGIIAGLLAMCTNNEHNMADTPCIIIGIAVFFFALQEHFSSIQKKIISGLLIICLLLLIWIGFTAAGGRSRIYGIGPGLFHEDTKLTKLASPPFFKGLSTGPKLTKTIEEMSAILKTDRESVFIGPRIDFGYAAFGITPPKGLPLWWEAFSRDDKTETREMVKRFQNLRFRTIILWDDTFFPPSLIQYINTAYDKTNWGGVVVYNLKGTK